MLTAEEISSVKADSYDGFWVIGELAGKPFKAEGFQRSEDETSEEMREAGYVYIENSYEFGKELWVEASEIQPDQRSQTIKNRENKMISVADLNPNHSFKDHFHWSNAVKMSQYKTVQDYIDHLKSMDAEVTKNEDADGKIYDQLGGVPLLIEYPDGNRLHYLVWEGTPWLN